MLLGKKYRFNNVFEARKNEPVMHEIAKLDNGYYSNIMDKRSNKEPLTLQEFIDISRCYKVPYTMILIKNGTHFKRVFHTSPNVYDDIHEILNNLLELDIGKICVADMNFEEIYSIARNHKVKIKIR